MFPCQFTHTITKTVPSATLWRGSLCIGCFAKWALCERRNHLERIFGYDTKAATKWRSLVQSATPTAPRAVFTSDKDLLSRLAASDPLAPLAALKDSTADKVPTASNGTQARSAGSHVDSPVSAGPPAV